MIVRDGNDERSNYITDALQDLTSDPKLYFQWQRGYWLWWYAVKPAHYVLITAP